LPDFAFGLGSESSYNTKRLFGRFLVAKGWGVVEVCEDFGVSRRADESERSGLIQVDAIPRAGTIRKVLVHEVSRLGHRNSIAHKFVGFFMIWGNKP